MTLNDAKKKESARHGNAPIVGSELAPGATGGESTATTPVNQQHTGQGVTRANTKRDGVVKICEWCGCFYPARRPKQSRFCGAACRRAAWMAANPDKAQAIAERDRARLKAYIIANGGTWEDRQGQAGQSSSALLASGAW